MSEKDFNPLITVKPGSLGNNFLEDASAIYWVHLGNKDGLQLERLRSPCRCLLLAKGVMRKDTFETNLAFHAASVAFHEEVNSRDYLVISFFSFFLYPRRCRINNSSKLDVSITTSKLKGVVSGRKKRASLLLVSLFSVVLPFMIKL